MFNEKWCYSNRVAKYLGLFKGGHSISDIRDTMVSDGWFHSKMAFDSFRRRLEKKEQRFSKEDGGEPKNKKKETSLKYQYNEDTDEYVFSPTSNGTIVKTFILSGEKVRETVRAYSNFGGSPSTLTDLTLSLGLPKNIVKHILLSLEITHDSLPYTKEEIEGKSEDELVERGLALKKFRINQKLHQQEWETIRYKASKYDEMNDNFLKVIDSVVKNLSVPLVLGKKVDKVRTESNDHFLITLSDTHWGALIDSVFCGKYSLEDAADKVTKYVNEIKTIAAINKYTNCTVVILGDILHSCLDGRTRKGTVLESQQVNEKLLDTGARFLSYFIKEVSKIFVTTRVFATKGNHDSILGYALYKIVEASFSKEKSVSFFVTQDYVGHFLIGNALIMYTHGGDDTTKSNLPSDYRLDSFVSSYLANNVKGVAFENVVLLSGHLHNLKHSSRSFYQHVIVPSSMPTDDYARKQGYFNDPEQVCFAINLDTGKIKNTFHVDLR